MPGAIVNIGFVVTDPDNLRGSETGESIVARDLDQSIFPQTCADLVALFGATLIVPQYRGSQHFAGIVE